MCGMVAPILFVLALAVFGFLREGYSHVSDAITDLQEVGSSALLGGLVPCHRVVPAGSRASDARMMTKS